MVLEPKKDCEFDGNYDAKEHELPLLEVKSSRLLRLLAPHRRLAIPKSWYLGLPVLRS